MVVAAVLNVDALRNRVADAIALVHIFERDLRPPRRACDHVERDPDRPAVPGPGTEVGVQARREPDRLDQRRRIRRDGEAVDAPVPGARAGEDRAARCTWQAQRTCSARQNGDYFVFGSSLGGILGIGLGTGTSKIISAAQNWPTLISLDSVAIAFLFSATVGIFFGFYPARKASQLDPIESLRYE